MMMMMSAASVLVCRRAILETALLWKDVLVTAVHCSLFSSLAATTPMAYPASSRLSARLIILPLVYAFQLLCCRAAAAAPLSPPPYLLGVHPQNRAHWESIGSAACDGRPLPLASINDGVCDCSDGMCCFRAHRCQPSLPLHLSHSIQR